jgi:autotransporter adhesin
VALGTNAKADGIQAVAIGAGANASFSGSVALGAGATTTVGSRTGYTAYAVAAPLNSAGEVSVGSAGAERQVTNVAAGSAATDAVNVGQLSQVAQNTASSLGGGATYDPTTGAYTAPSYAVGGNTYHDVGAALGASNTIVTNQGNSVVAQIGGGTTYNADTGTIGGGFTVNGTTYASVAAAVGDVAASAGNAVQYDDAGHSSVTLGGVGATAPIGLHNVAAGDVSAGSTDAVNGDQLNTTNQQVAQNSTDITNLDDTTTANSNAIGALQQDALQWNPALGAYDASHGSGAPQRITNVAPAVLSQNSTDAVNGSQLYATNQQVAQNTGNIANNTSAINNLSNQVGQNTTDIASNTNQINNLGNQVSQNTSDIDNLSSGIANGSVGLVQQTGGAPGNGQITIGGSTGGTSINVAGTDGDRVISGVANGVAPDDAVNVSQLAAAITNASQNAVGYDDSSHTSVTFNKGGAATGLHNVAAGDVSAGSTDAVNGSQLYTTNQQVASNTTQITQIESGQAGPFRSNNTSNLAAPSATGADAVAGGFGAVASGAQSTAIGANSSATGKNSVALGYGSTDGGVDNVVSVGAPGAERQITNVAAGTRDTDAVNVSQLNQGMASTLTQANNYTDSRIAAINYDLSRFRKDADSGTASAMAVAGLPQAFEPGKGMIAGAFGVYRDETSFAFGASKIFNDGHTIVKGGATFTTRSAQVGANVGIGYQF